MGIFVPGEVRIWEFLCFHLYCIEILVVCTVQGYAIENFRSMTKAQFRTDTIFRSVCCILSLFLFSLIYVQIYSFSPSVWIHKYSRSYISLVLNPSINSDLPYSSQEENRYNNHFVLINQLSKHKGYITKMSHMKHEIYTKIIHGYNRQYTMN